MPETTEEIRTCCADLRVLGRKDFKMLLKWRLKAREAFGMPTKNTKMPEVSEEVAEVESMDDELKIQEELQALKDKDSAKRKRERRRENEMKQKDIVRMQLHMVAPMVSLLFSVVFGPHILTPNFRILVWNKLDL